MRSINLIVVATLIFTTLFNTVVFADSAEETVPTATAVPVSLPTPIPIVATESQNNGVGNITRTPTPEGSAYLEAITEANVRAQADPESERLGTIRAGDTYSIIGRYYHWYQFHYDQSANGIGWVFDELVNLSGNTNRIVDLSLSTSTPDTDTSQLESTLAILPQTPGGYLTATAGVGVVPLPRESNSNLFVNSSQMETTSPLPTFTIPPSLLVITTSESNPNTPEPSIVVTNEPDGNDITIPSRIPPILPIIMLGFGGLLGLLISSLRK